LVERGQQCPGRLHVDRGIGDRPSYRVVEVACGVSWLERTDQDIEPWVLAGESIGDGVGVEDVQTSPGDVEPLLNPSGDISTIRPDCMSTR
jgi:hypothetical protein